MKIYSLQEENEKMKAGHRQKLTPFESTGSWRPERGVQTPSSGKQNASRNTGAPRKGMNIPQRPVRLPQSKSGSGRRNGKKLGFLWYIFVLFFVLFNLFVKD